MKKLIFAIVLGFPLAVGSLAIYSMAETDIEHLILSVTDDVSYIPQSVSEYYLYNFRPTEEDIKSMEARSGLSFISAIESPKRERLMAHFIDKGLPINGISHYSGLTALHAAILFNDHNMVKFLLEHGADPSVKSTDEHTSGLPIDEKFNFLTAVEFLDYLDYQNPSVNREEIKGLLAPFRE